MYFNYGVCLSNQASDLGPVNQVKPPGIEWNLNEYLIATLPRFVLN